jgi:uridine kinase
MLACWFRLAGTGRGGNIQATTHQRIAMTSKNLSKPLIIGIGGGTGAGKTTLARRLAQLNAEPGTVLVDQDSYYLDRSHLSAEQRALINYDEPAALDNDLLLRHVERLAAGEHIQKPCYCFVTHTRTPEVNEIHPAPLVILEGLMALWDERLRALMGLKIFVDADADIRMLRRLTRDVQERGRTLDSTVAQYRDTIRPMHRRYVEPTKAYADLVVDTTETALEEWLAPIDRILLKVRGSAGEGRG